jgi:MFS family permease
MNTANAVGYLIGALAAAPVAARLGDKRSFVLGLLLTAVSLIATGLSNDYAVLVLLRAVAGAAGALSLVTGGALASAAGGGSKGRPALALGVYFGGAGFGMVVSALAIPALVAAGGWRLGWFALGVLGAVATVAVLPALARAPHIAAREQLGPPAFGMYATRGLRAMLASYVLFGAGYIAYTTFIVAYLRSRLDFGAADVTLFWAFVGLAAMLAGLAWGPLLAAAVRRPWRRAGECRGHAWGSPAGDDCHAAGRLCISGAVRWLVPDRSDLGYGVRAQGRATAVMDRRNRHADRRLRRGPVHWTVAERCRVRCTVWGGWRTAAVRGHSRRRGADRTAATRAGADLRRARRPISPGVRYRKSSSNPRVQADG